MDPLEHTRDPAVDLYRMAAIAVVVVGHWLASIVFSGGRFADDNVLVTIPWTRWPTLLFQVIPVFFLAAGSAALGYANYLFGWAAMDEFAPAGGLPAVTSLLYLGGAGLAALVHPTPAGAQGCPGPSPRAGRADRRCPAPITPAHAEIERRKRGGTVDRFSPDDLALLLDQSATGHVSLYLPAHPVGPDVQQDPIRLANLVHHAEAELRRRGVRHGEIDALLSPARALIDNVKFWQQEGDGVAAFFRTGWWRVFRLPLGFDELAVVSDRFHVLPLLPVLAAGDENTGRFFVLALSENDATLYAGTRTSLRTVPVPGLPHGVRDALRYDEPQKQRGHHLGVRLGAKVRPVLHGQGVGGEVQKERLGRYLHAVDHAVSPVLRNERAPLVLAGVDRIRAGYRQLTHYPHVLADGLPGSPDHVPAPELHADAWPIVAKTFARTRDDAVATVREELGTGLATDDLAEIARAAVRSRCCSSTTARPRTYANSWRRLSRTPSVPTAPSTSCPPTTCRAAAQSRRCCGGDP